MILAGIIIGLIFGITIGMFVEDTFDIIKRKR